MEGAGGLGRSVALHLVAAGERVVDVPAKLSSPARLLPTGNTRKNDQVGTPFTLPWPPLGTSVSPICGRRYVGAEEHSEILRMLSERREDLIKERTRPLNRLHALLRETSLRAELRRTSRRRRPLVCCAAYARAAAPHVPGEGWPRTC